MLGTAIAAPPQPTRDPARITIDLLHEGRFDAAAATLAAVPDSERDVRWAFLRAFVTYWRLLFDPGEPALMAALEVELQRAMEFAPAVADESADPETALWLGSSRLLNAQMHVAEKKYFKAGYEAKRARALLQTAATKHSADASFGLGTYNYFASRVPAVVKGLRFMLALPGGDRELGLAQLEAAAQGSRYFGLESWILLVTILSSHDERRYLEALDASREALRTSESPLVAEYAAGVLDLALARSREAAARFDRARARATGSPGADPSVTARILWQSARAHFELFRPDLALEDLRPFREGDLPVPFSLAESVSEMEALAERWTRAPSKPPEGGREPRAHDPGGLTDEKVRASLTLARPALDLEAAGDIGASARELLALVTEHPDDDVLALLAGRALVLLEQPDPRALQLLRQAESRITALPRRWQGPCRLFAGNAADLMGERRLAETYYRKASQSPGFTGKSASYFYAEHPYPDPRG
jgi:tetratricopeptide (TPR) repeat protein